MNAIGSWYQRYDIIGSNAVGTDPIVIPGDRALVPIDVGATIVEERRTWEAKSQSHKSKGAQNIQEDSKPYSAEQKKTNVSWMPESP